QPLEPEMIFTLKFSNGVQIFKFSLPTSCFGAKEAGHLFLRHSYQVEKNLYGNNLGNLSKDTEAIVKTA
ncbi:hypothetical protein STEG23_026483, partial [Scotinomys teguina]